MDTVDLSGEALWPRFRDAFVASVLYADQQKLASAWVSQAARTAFHREVTLPAIANELGLAVMPELFKLDFVMAAESPLKMRVPVIFVESENNPMLATQEVCKLAVLAAPLRVLITTAEWSDRWPSGGQKGTLLPRWQAILRAHSEMNGNSGWFGLVVGEMTLDDHIRFYTLALGPDGEIRDPETMRFDWHVEGGSI